MTDQRAFETGLREDLVAFASTVDQPFDPDAIVRAVVAAQPRPIRWWRRRSATDRRLLQLLAAAALLAGLVAALAVASRQPPTAEELVERSQRAHEQPPVFEMTTTVYDVPGDGMTFHGCMSIWFMGEEDVPAMRVRNTWDGQGRFRIDCLDPPDPTAFIVEDATRYAIWDGATWTESEDRFRSGQSTTMPPATVDWLNWHNIGFAERRPIGLIECASWVLGSRATVAGRAATEVACGPDRYWIDDRSHLLVRREIDGITVEAVDFAGGIPDVSLFEFEPPPNVRRSLAVGESPPDWLLPRLGGGEFGSAALHGRPAAVLVDHGFCSQPDPCLDVAAFAAEVGARRERLNAAVLLSAASYGIPTEFPVPSVDPATLASLPTVFDDGLSQPGWFQPQPGVVLLDADGRVEALQVFMSRTSLGNALDALIRGEPIPAPPAGDGVLTEGSAPPPLAGDLLGGGSFNLADEAGRPVVVVMPGDAYYTAAGRVEALVADVRAMGDLVGDRARVVMLAFDPEIWEDATGPIYASDDRLAFLAQQHGASAWEALGRPRIDSSASAGRSRVALVVVDPTGLVHRVYSDDLPEPDELAAVVDALL